VTRLGVRSRLLTSASRSWTPWCYRMDLNAERVLATVSSVNGMNTSRGFGVCSVILGAACFGSAAYFALYGLPDRRIACETPSVVSSLLDQVTRMHTELHNSKNVRRDPSCKSLRVVEAAFEAFDDELDRCQCNLSEADKFALNELASPSEKKSFGELLAHLLLIFDDETLKGSYLSKNAAACAVLTTGYYAGAYKLLGIGIVGAVKGGWIATLMAKGGAISFGSSVWWLQSLTGLKASIYATTWSGMLLPWAACGALVYGTWKGWDYLHRDARKVDELERVLLSMTKVLMYNS